MGNHNVCGLCHHFLNPKNREACVDDLCKDCSKAVTMDELGDAYYLYKEIMREPQFTPETRALIVSALGSNVRSIQVTDPIWETVRSAYAGKVRVHHGLSFFAQACTSWWSVSTGPEQRYKRTYGLNNDYSDYTANKLLAQVSTRLAIDYAGHAVDCFSVRKCPEEKCTNFTVGGESHVCTDQCACGAEKHILYPLCAFCEACDLEAQEAYYEEAHSKYYSYKDDNKDIFHNYK